MSAHLITTGINSNLTILGENNGIIFGDGTKQTSAGGVNFPIIINTGITDNTPVIQITNTQNDSVYAMTCNNITENPDITNSFSISSLSGNGRGGYMLGLSNTTQPDNEKAILNLGVFETNGVGYNQQCISMNSQNIAFTVPVFPFSFFSTNSGFATAFCKFIIPTTQTIGASATIEYKGVPLLDAGTSGDTTTFTTQIYTAFAQYVGGSSNYVLTSCSAIENTSFINLQLWNQTAIDRTITEGEIIYFMAIGI